MVLGYIPTENQPSIPFEVPAGMKPAAYRVNETAGRTVTAWDYLNNREQLIYGDTGWRNINVSSAASVTGTIRDPEKPGTLRLRREGRTVTARISDVGLAAGGSQGVLFSAGDIPQGFRASSDGPFVNLRDLTMGYATYHTAYASASSIRWMSFWTGSTLSQSRPVGGAASGEFSWITDDPWPTSLPGTAVSVIPYQ